MNLELVQRKLEYINGLKGKEKKPVFEEALKEGDFLDFSKMTLDTSMVYNISNVKAGEGYPESEGITDERIMAFLYSLTKKIGANKVQKEHLAKMANTSEVRLDMVNRILKGNLGCGCSIKTINEVAPGVIPYFPYMRCEKSIKHLEKLDYKTGVFSQLKANGLFMDIFPDEKLFQTRNGGARPMPNFENIFKRLPSGFVLSGEALVLDDCGCVLPRAKGNGIINKSRVGTMSTEEASRIRFQLWDIVANNVRFGKSKTSASYAHRFECLKKVVADLNDPRFQVIETRIVRSIEEAWDHYAEVRARPKVNGKRLEGTVAKNANAVWKDGTSQQQVKLKAEKECELLVIGWKKGDPGGKWKNNLGSFICQSSCGKLITDVGMGLSDELRLSDPELMVGQTMSTIFNEVTKAEGKDTYALSHARMVEPRPDKPNGADDLAYILKVKSGKRRGK